MELKNIVKYTLVILFVYALFTGNFLSFFRKSTENKIVQLKGSDTILSLSQTVAEEYMRQHPQARISVTGGGSGTGIASKINKTVDIAMASREMKDSEYEKAEKNGTIIKEVTIAYDAITIVVNKKNKINNLTMEQLRDIYIGKIKNWKELGGEDKEIVVISRDSSSGTHMYFKEHVLRKGKSKGKEEFGNKTLFLPSNESIKQQITTGEGTISYLGLGYLDETVKPLKIDGITANVENVKNKTYPISRGVYWYTDEKIEGITKKLVDFMMSKEGQKIVETEGFVPVK